MLYLIPLLLSVHVPVEEGFRPAGCPVSSCWQMEVSSNTLMTPARNPNCQLVKHVQKLIVLLSWSLGNGPRWANLNNGEPKPSIATKALKISAWVNKLSGAARAREAVLKWTVHPCLQPAWSQPPSWAVPHHWRTRHAFYQTCLAINSFMVQLPKSKSLHCSGIHPPLFLFNASLLPLPIQNDLENWI